MKTFPRVASRETRPADYLKIVAMIVSKAEDLSGMADGMHDAEIEALIEDPRRRFPIACGKSSSPVSKEAVEALRNLIETQDVLRAIIEAMEAADEAGARYAILPNGELAIYTVRSPLPSDLWHELHGWRQEIAESWEHLASLAPSSWRTWRA